MKVALIDNMNNNFFSLARYLRDSVVSDNVRIGPQTWIGSSVFLDEVVLIAQPATNAGSVSIGKHAAVWGNSRIPRF